MPDIEIYEHYEIPMKLSWILTRVEDRDFSEEPFFTEGDRSEVERIWQDVVAERGDSVFSEPKTRGTLYDTTRESSTFRTTDFKTYLAVTQSHKERTLSEGVYRNMRVSAVGGALVTQDGKVFIHKRSKNATHVPNAWDSSVAGRADVDGATIDFEKTIYGALRRELKIVQAEINQVRITGLHTAHDPDFRTIICPNVWVLCQGRRYWISPTLSGDQQFHSCARHP